MNIPEPFEALETESGSLPTASTPQVLHGVRELLVRHKRGFFVLMALNGVAALASVVGPQVLGSIVEGVQTGVTMGFVDKAAAIFLVALLVQAGFTRWARMRAAILGEGVLADLRESFVSRVIQLPPGLVESAGTGDLVTRTTTDIDRLSWAVRLAVPEIAIALVTAVIIFVALLWTSAVLAVAWIVAVPPIAIAGRWYFKRATKGYRAEMQSYSRVNGTITETIDAGRTIEGYRLGEQRVERADKAIARWLRWERYTLFLRSVFFPSVEAAYVLPTAAVLALGGALYIHGSVTLAQVTTAVLYTQMLIEPVDLILMWYDELQVGQASMARLLGVHYVDQPDALDDAEPNNAHIEAREVRFGYREGRDVLHGVDLDVSPGARIAIVGPSGAGKSTLGRLLAGLHKPRTGTIEMGGVELGDLPPETVRRHVALVTQEHHVFVGSLRDNLLLAYPTAGDEQLWDALRAVDAEDWVSALPEQLDTEVGTGGHKLSPAQAQQLALARLVLADPHTLVLDEATSLIDPRAARHLEQSLAAVLEGRTVIAIAHRLTTAHDAQQVVVVEDGVISESGSHKSLVAADGPYAALWKSWRDEP